MLGKDADKEKEALSQLIMQYFQYDGGTTYYKHARLLLFIVINNIINYIEMFSTSGTPKDWLHILVAHSEREEDGRPNVYEYGILIKEMTEAEGKQVKAVIKKFREYLLTKLVPSFLANYLLAMKLDVYFIKLFVDDET